MSPINRSFFISQVRATLFSGRLKQSQVDGLTGLLDVWEARHAASDDRWLAYALATAHLETDRTMRPIAEYGSVARKTRLYDVTGEQPNRAKRHGNTAPGDGVRYAGRGFVQLTWKNNYQRAGDAIGVDLVADPDLALRTNIAARLLFDGMIAGWFTGKKFADYLNATRADWVGARRIINGRDKADLIAGYALNYYAAISYTV